MPAKDAMNKVDVIITQGWGRIAYNIVRSLGRRGIKVCIGTDRFSGMADYSRYKASTFKHPCCVDKPREFVRQLREAMLFYSPEVYIPSDEEAYIVARHIDAFRDLSVRIPIAPFETIRALHLKNESSSLASSIGIPTPHTIVPITTDDVTSFSKQYGYPIVLKKVSSSSAHGTYFLNQSAIRDFPGWMRLNDIRFGDFLIQQYVKGVGYGVSMLFNNGQMRARFTHKRLQEISSQGGVSTQRVSITNRHLEDCAEQLLKKVNYHGVAMVEFKYNEETQQSWFIEVNPRFWGSVALAIQSGVDFPYLLYKSAIDGDVDTVLDYRTGINVKWILGDLLRLIRSMRKIRRGSYNNTHHPCVDGYDDFYWDDPLPFLAEVILAARKKLVDRHNKARRDICLDDL